MPYVYTVDISNHHSYASVWKLQSRLMQDIIKAKRNNASFIPNYLLLCEHSPVFTLGKSGDPSHLLLKDESLEDKNIEFFKINRGGDITYHGPGQITGYPIFNLDAFYRDLHRYVRELEEVAIRTLAEFGLEGRRLKEYTGVWLKDRTGGYAKICAIGVHMSRWVSMHGFALNVNTDLRHFDYIVPCGIQEEDKRVTNMRNEIGTYIQMADVRRALRKHFREIFGFEYM